MYIVPVEVKKSLIHGRGVHAKVDIPEGTTVWEYREGHDKKMSPGAFEKLDKDARKALEKIAYLSPRSDMWVIPPTNDPACFRNHSSTANLSVVMDDQKSSEPVFVANRKIIAGEELTNNYQEFDRSVEVENPNWLS